MSVALAFSVAVGPALTASAAVSNSASTKGLSYVALGDSYAAGYGLDDPTGEPVAACAQSADDYPHRVAAALDLKLTDVSCSGAETGNVVSTRQDGAAPQADALGSTTKIVTISIGGNDAGLFSTASSCIALSRTGPVIAHATNSSCRSTLVTGGGDSLAHDISTTVRTGLARAFSTVRAKAPHAQVFVVGYPAIFPDTAHTPKSGCFRPVVDFSALMGKFPTDGFPFTDADVAYLSGVQRKLDTTTRQATERAGFTYVSTLAASQAHSGCATTGSYLQGITLEGTSGLTDISLKPGALHPNSAGAAFLSTQTETAIRAAFAPKAEHSSPLAKSSAADPLWIVLAAAFVVACAIVVAFAPRRSRRRRAASVAGAAAGAAAGARAGAGAAAGAAAAAAAGAADADPNAADFDADADAERSTR